MPYKDRDQRKACHREVMKRARAKKRDLYWGLFLPYRSQSVEAEFSLDDPAFDQSRNGRAA